jgi:Uncharacterised nucleotidyltransferase
VAPEFSDRQLPFLPTLHQELLLKACLLNGAEALAAWQAWHNSTNLDYIDIHSIRLLPFLAAQLFHLGVEDPAFEKYRGVQRRAWAHNQLLFHAAAAILKRLKTEQIPAMALKGVVLASSYYESMSLRPMDDIDLLVRRVDALRALTQLEGLGWLVLPGQFQPRTPDDCAVRPACALENPSNLAQVDLHWRLLWARFSEDAERMLWQRAIPFEIDGAGCVAPCPADLLVHVCAHGARWSDPPSVRWVIDAALVVRAGNVDWTHVCSQAERLGLAVPLLETLDYLRTVMDVPVPDIVIQDLRRLHVTSIDRLLHECELQPPTKMSLLTAIKIHRHVAWHELARSHGLSGYWRYYSALRQGRSLGELASWVWRRLARSAIA